ncbi:hypothetical protein F3Y22_tig00113124pilonHSYRG00376 [Hibiscus syriacus]|uniref:Isopenicillin N synthase-like Fe(2+) 2OG dioxygenase domain-containing protein n=1 Tax=Hibiscus syriacus TaxID=106335 RepID=A0A6A2Y0K1_HIBSY|nr:hypothetical protein F3Y22_tig00113124pilonHSYRG00376 [Hibiscus syriacus]
MTIDEAQVAANIEQGPTSTFWPHGNISFSKTLVWFTELASRLEKTVQRMVLEIFGVDNHGWRVLEDMVKWWIVSYYVEPSPNSFIVMVGESLKIWLNGGLCPTYHRVMMKGDNARYSVGLFAAPRGGYQVKAPEELVDDKNPVLFKPFDYEEFLGFYLTQVAPVGARAGLTTYCSA